MRGFRIKHGPEKRGLTAYRYLLIYLHIKITIFSHLQQPSIAIMFLDVTYALHSNFLFLHPDRGHFLQHPDRVIFYNVQV